MLTVYKISFRSSLRSVRLSRIKRGRWLGEAPFLESASMMLGFEKDPTLFSRPRRMQQ
jgi:hypothetical protein